MCSSDLYLNSFSEDWARVAVWLSKAYPTARRDAEALGIAQSATELNSAINQFLEAIATGDPKYAALHTQALEKSIQFLGDLHRGGKIASIIRIAIPFQQWYTHIIKLTLFTMPLKYPGRTLFLQQLAQLGQWYQDAHNVTVPWGYTFVPFGEDQYKIDGQPQWVTRYIDANSWYPEATTTGLTQPFNFMHGITNGQLDALLYNSTAALALFGQTPALAPDNRTFLNAAKDEYGNDISGKDLWWYMFHNVQLSLPLAPTLMSMSGQADTSSLVHRAPKAPGIAEMKAAPLDIFSLGTDPEKWMWMMVKAITGMQEQHTPGLGPVYTKQLARQYDSNVRARREEANRIREYWNAIMNPPEVTGG